MCSCFPQDGSQLCGKLLAALLEAARYSFAGSSGGSAACFPVRFREFCAAALLAVARSAVAFAAVSSVRAAPLGAVRPLLRRVAAPSPAFSRGLGATAAAVVAAVSLLPPGGATAALASAPGCDRTFAHTLSGGVALPCGSSFSMNFSIWWRLTTLLLVIDEGYSGRTEASRRRAADAVENVVTRGRAARRSSPPGRCPRCRCRGPRCPWRPGCRCRRSWESKHHLLTRCACSRILGVHGSHVELRALEALWASFATLHAFERRKMIRCL